MSLIIICQSLSCLEAFKITVAIRRTHCGGVSRRQPGYASITREKSERYPTIPARTRSRSDENQKEAAPCSTGASSTGSCSGGRCTARTASGTCKRAGPYVRREARESAVAAQRREAGDDVRPGTTDMSDRRLGDGTRELHAGVA